MAWIKGRSDAVFLFLNDLSCRVVAKSGIANDRFHIGKLILQSFKDAPDHILQIDGGTGESETFQSALKRSVQCAKTFKSLGLKTNDVILVSGPNHIDLTIPMYAAFYLGIKVACMDPALEKREILDTLRTCRPKVILGQYEKVKDIEDASKELKLDVTIVPFNKGSQGYISFNDFIKKGDDNVCIEDFQAANFDTEDTVGVLITTSGTTGTPKCAALSHKNMAIGMPYTWIMCSNYPTPTKRVLVLSPIQWLSAVSHFVLSPILRFTRIQTSLQMTTEHIYALINKYKPSYSLMGPAMMSNLLKQGGREKCDFSCFENILMGGSVVHEKLIEKVKEAMPRAEVNSGYGFTEAGTMVFCPINRLPGSCGKPLGHAQYKLVDPESGHNITEPNKPGELWIKGPITFKGYYNNPEGTADIYTKDRWIKSGDIFYVDEYFNFFFVDRLKLLLKYRNHQISPAEIEAVIQKLPGVQDVAVTGITDFECGELPVACVVPNEVYRLTAQEIKEAVKESLTDSKQLRGGVIFMKELPLTSTSKVNRKKLKEMVQDMKAE